MQVARLHQPRLPGEPLEALTHAAAVASALLWLRRLDAEGRRTIGA